MLLITVVAVTAAPNQGKLEIFSSSPGKLQAVYYTGDGKGLQVTSTVNDERHSVSVSNLDGLQLVSAQSFASAVLWDIMGHKILLHRSDGGGMKKYASGMKHDQFRPNFLDSASTEETRHSAFTELLSRPEMDTMFKMSRALGDAGVQGHKNAAALNFHGLALNFAKIQGHAASVSSFESHKAIIED